VPFACHKLCVVSMKSTWPKIHTRSHRSGNTGYIVDLGKIDGKRERHSFKTKGEAQTFAELKRIQRENEGIAGLSLSQDIRVDAAKASDLLSPHAISLERAAKYYLDHVIAYQNAPIVKVIIERMIADAKRNERRHRTIKDLENRLNLFGQDFGQSKLAEITVEDLKEWLAEDEWAPRTRINYATKISQLYNYAINHNWAEHNLALRVERPSTEDKEPEIFTVDQAHQLLRKAHKHGLLPYVCLGLFAGLRSAELMRLDAAAVKLDGRSIVISKAVAKKRSRRVVEIHETLATWLNLGQPLKGPVANAATFRDSLDALKKDVGLSRWPHNGLRHSFGSYHLAAFGDQMKTAMMMGHRSSDVIHNHYKALVSKAEAERYWALRP
jgi:integrase